MIHKTGLEILDSMYHMCTMALCVHVAILCTCRLQSIKKQHKGTISGLDFIVQQTAQMFSLKNRMTRIRHDKVLFLLQKGGALLKGKKGVSARDRGSKGFFAEKKAQN